MRKQTPQTNLSEALKPQERELLREIETDRKISEYSEGFLYYMDTLHRKIIAITNPEQKKIHTGRASDTSRYTEKGIQKIREKIHQRLAAYPATFGVMLTLTVADDREGQTIYNGLHQLEAWERIGRLGRSFIDELNKWRKRHKLSKVRAYVKVLEIQANRGYPHLHIYCPGLKWLAPKEIISRLWTYGETRIEHTDSTAPGDYVNKYLSKVDGKDFMNLMLFTFHLRMFSNSRGLKYSKEIRKKSSWGFFLAGSRYSIQPFIQRFIEAGYSSAGNLLTEPRGP